MSDLRAVVGQRIRAARMRAGLSQGELGRRMTRPRTHAAISDLERGKIKIDLEEINEIADLVQCDAAWLASDVALPFGGIVPFGEDVV